MAEELQQLLEKIQHDGVEKAKAAADAILEKARADADAIVRNAQNKARSVLEKAEADAKAFAERSGRTVSQAARDTVIEVRDAVGRLLENLLAKDVSAALADPAEAAALARTVLNGLALPAGADAEVKAGARLAEALKAQLAAEAATGVKVVLDEAMGAGFAVRLDGGRVEHDFSEAAIVAALAKHLRPDLAKLVQA